ncbi:MAG: SagB/ThcOx family dehydrogenase [Thaumarchaeota archaeon]|nr:SagB/ThcOx family dehydrogenase [Nitrososphaerota archaeon]
MKNYETEAAWEYHNGTKHPNGILLDRLHTYHPAKRPSPYKRYRNARQIRLSPDKRSSGISALDAISGSIKQDKDIVLDINLLSSILYFSGGITKTLKFSPPLGEVEFRAASCTGALYHIEIYIVCSDIPGLDAGVYHFDPKNMSLSVLRKGDYRRVLADATADDSASRSAVTLVFTDIFSRNSIKYQAREYRHAFWDCGTMLANSLAMASAHKIPYRITMGFVDSQINQILGLDEKKEAALALLSFGSPVQYSADPLPPDKIAESEPLEHDFDLTAINNMHDSSSLTSRQEVSAWKNQADQKVVHTDKKENNIVRYASTDESVEQTIIRRGSTRKFSHDSISQEQLLTILAMSTKGIVSDFEENNTINEIYLIVNAVDGVEQGAYFYNKKENLLELLQKGEMRYVSGHLGLDQNLPFDASVTIFFMVDLQKVLQQFGNRGYRVAQMDAGITAGKMYLASYALKIGATGLTFYDDEVTDFFSPHASNKSVMFMLAIGKKAKA